MWRGREKESKLLLSEHALLDHRHHRVAEVIPCEHRWCTTAPRAKKKLGREPLRDPEPAPWGGEAWRSPAAGSGVFRDFRQAVALLAPEPQTQSTKPGDFALPRGIWQGLVAFWVVTMGRGCY